MKSLQGPDLLEHVTSRLARGLANHVLHEQVQVILEVGNHFDCAVLEEEAAYFINFAWNEIVKIDLIFKHPYGEASLEVWVNRLHLRSNSLACLRRRAPAFDEEGGH